MHSKVNLEISDVSEWMRNFTSEKAGVDGKRAFLNENAVFKFRIFELM